jgi:hypothetical protein
MLTRTLTSAAAKKMQTAAAIMMFQLLLRARKARKEVRERRLGADVPIIGQLKLRDSVT